MADAAAHEMKKKIKTKHISKLKRISRKDPELSAQAADAETRRQIEISREIMREYREVFERLAKM
jgi:hypothetical protein